ncbi:MAG: hypothetical protein J6581_08560 [Apibacter sp.]|nr:hypothetical protein [Apibacter sp.]
MLPGVIKLLKEEKKDKILRLVKEILSLQSDSTEELINDTINAIETLFHSMKYKTRLW